MALLGAQSQLERAHLLLLGLFFSFERGGILAASLDNFSSTPLLGHLERVELLEARGGLAEQVD